MMPQQTTLTLMWWNLYNLHDDKNDPKIDDIVKTTRIYHRDLREVAEIIDRVMPIPDVIGCSEVENHGVMRDLAQEIHWQSTHRAYHCDQHIESRDPRGIDVAALIRTGGPLSEVKLSAYWPSDQAAVRPLIVIDAMMAGDPPRPITLVLVHGKSRRSGACHDNDPMPGSRIRYSYGLALKRLAEESGAAGVPLIVLGDLNDEPESLSLREAAGAVVGRPEPGTAIATTLYNLSYEGRADARGTCMHNDSWLFFDQILVNGVTLLPELGGVEIVGRQRIIAEDPLLYQGQPNRWYSDHLPVMITLRRVER
jgi:Endonuclease/Exonuclease/phosphatase family